MWKKFKAQIMTNIELETTLPEHIYCTYVLLDAIQAMKAPKSDVGEWAKPHLGFLLVMFVDSVNSLAKTGYLFAPGTSKRLVLDMLNFVEITLDGFPQSSEKII